MFPNLPIFADFHQDGGHQPQARSIIRKDDHHPGPSADLFVDPFQTIGGADRSPDRNSHPTDYISGKVNFLNNVAHQNP